MKQVFFRFFLLSLILLIGACSSSRRGVYTPSASPEHDMQQNDEKRRENVKKNDKPLREGQIRRNMRKRDKRQRKDFTEHHERIQQKEVQKRMKKNQRAAQARNDRKKPNIIRRIIVMFSE